MCTQSPPPTNLGSEDDNDLANHPTLYFDDGSVILQCSSTLFCVHRGLLQKHSSVFSEIFKDEDRDGDMFRGKMLIALEDDEEKDIALLLENIYDGFRVYYRLLTDDNFDSLARLLRICTKYCVDRPREAILQRLRLSWPASLESYDTRPWDAYSCLSPTVDIRRITVHPAKVISLLRSCSYESQDLLAPLFYAVTTCVSESVAESAFILSAPDLGRLICGMNKIHCIMMQVAAGSTFPFDADEIHECENQNRVLSIYRHILERTVSLYAAEPIEGWAVMISAFKDLEREEVCRACYSGLVDFMETTRRDMWDSLADIFDLQSEECLSCRRSERSLSREL
ncbi:hypothetical protein B0H10DRAFT_2012934 [Mycena sp. CBHHK59/15]|nr:hypothetical protein B0H10DRAFT_2012934 [Mycena sp. CBHHK59/15]